jgi:chorismate synthase
MNSFGVRLRLSVFGESHGVGVGAVVDGLPAGLAVRPEAIQADLDARRPGQSKLVSQRSERDRVEILSGVRDGRATGAPVALWIRNEDADSRPYADAGRLPRPGHADWTQHVATFGHADLRGGGHASGRLTAPWVAAGALVEPLLAGHGIVCAAHLHQVGGLAGPPHAHDAQGMRERAASSPVKTAHSDVEAEFAAVVEEARRSKDSVGGVVEFAADGLPPGLGDPFFDSLESRLAHAFFSIPAAKGVDFGEGFRAAGMRGSEHNDAFEVRDGSVRPATNHAGGILGGRSTGETLRGRVALKPTSTLPGRTQQTVDLETMEESTLQATGRHDPCIAIRAVPVVQAALRLVVADAVLHARETGLLRRLEP